MPLLNAIQKPPVRLLIAWVVVFTLLVVYGKARFFRDPGSIFYDPDRAGVRKYTDFRLKQVADFVHHHIAGDQQSPIDALKGGNGSSLCVHFATVRRDGQQYIDDSIASILQGLSPEEREDIYISVFFANADPTLHPSYGRPWIRQVVDEVYSVPQDDKDFLRLQQLEQNGDFKAKGIADYVRGLQHCYDKGTPFILMFEGDVLAADGWLVKTREGLAKIRKARSDWIYMRLFNQERSTGWASTEIGENNEFKICLGVGVVVFFLAKALRLCTRSTPAFTGNGSLAVICILIIPSFVVFFFQAGKANILPPRPGVFAQNFGCCSQALVFPREQIQGLTGYLTTKARGQVDLMVNDYAREKQLSRFSLYPVQVQHIGMQSARGTTEDEARSIWSMAFEDKNPAKLDSEHRRLVESIYHPRQ